MQIQNQFKAKLPILPLLVILLFLTQSWACDTETVEDSAIPPTQAPPTAIFTPEPPTLTPTLVPPTETSTPSLTDTPTSVPTATFIPGSEAPFQVSGLELKLASVGQGENYKGFVPSNITPSQIVLWVDLELLSGEMDDLIALEKWVEDENGTKIGVGAGLSTGPVVSLLFPVPRGSTSFVLYFSSGEAVDLTPLLP